MLAITPVRAQKSLSGGRHMDHFARTFLLHASDEPEVHDILPDRKAWTGCPPGVHYISVWSWLLRNPFDQIKHERFVFDGSSLSLDRHRALSFRAQRLPPLLEALPVHRDDDGTAEADVVL